jgi:hypothetical protein
VSLNALIFRHVLIALAMLIMTACGFSTQELAATIVARTETARQLSTVAVGQAFASALTELASTGTATSTATPTLIPTSTSDPNLRAAVTAEVAFIWSGPGEPFHVILNAKRGDQFRPTGWSEDGQWLLVLLENGDTGWIAASQMEIGEQGASLPVLPPPPEPTAAALFTFTVFSAKGSIELTVHTTGQVFRFRQGQTHEFQIEGGWQTFTYTSTIGVNCVATFFIDHDIHFRPDGELFCESLPGGIEIWP